MRRLLAALKWLHPGMRVKRWVVLGLIGLLIFLAGMGVIMQSHREDSKPLAVRVAEWIIANVHAGVGSGTLGVILTLLGALLCIVAFLQLIHSLTSVLEPEMRAGGL